MQLGHLTRIGLNGNANIYNNRYGYRESPLKSVSRISLFPGKNQGKGLPGIVTEM